MVYRIFLEATSNLTACSVSSNKICICAVMSGSDECPLQLILVHMRHLLCPQSITILPQPTVTASLPCPLSLPDEIGFSGLLTRISSCLIPFSFFNNCTIMVKIHSYSVERNYDSYTSIRQLVQLIPDLSSKLLIVCLPASPLPTSPCFTDCCIFFLFSILF